MSALAKLKKLLEAGARHSTADMKHIQGMHDSSVALGASCGANASESSFSHSDLATIISNEVREQINPSVYVCDIFDTQIAYCNYYPTTDCWLVDYSVDDNGNITFGTPQEVVRKVTYVPTEPNEPPVDDAMAMESQIAELSTDCVELVEKAVDTDGTVMLKLISPGIGSSGYYSEAVLKRDGPKVFTKGLHNLIDHPTPQEEASRPEGSVTKLGSTLVEDARWLDDYKGYGAGLYARAKVVPGFRETLDVIASDIGTSIRASGKVHIGTVDGKEVPIIDTIEKAKSVDYVTLPGRGGKVISLMESAAKRPIGDQTMAIDEKEFKQLQESNRALVDQLARLQEAETRRQASTLVEKTLGEYRTLSEATRSRVRASVENAPIPMADGAIDAQKLAESVKNAVASEMAYLASLGIGQVRGLGASAPLSEASIEDIEKEISANLAKL